MPRAVSPEASGARGARLVPARRDVPPVLDPTVEKVPESRQLPPHQTKTERIGSHVAALSADLREYVELRVALVQRKVEGVIGIVERLQHLASTFKFAVPGALLVILGLLFLLVTLAIGLGALLGSYWGGFAIVTGTLIAVGGLLLWLAWRQFNKTKEIMAEAKREAQNARTVTREEVQEAERLTARQSAV